MATTRSQHGMGFWFFLFSFLSMHSPFRCVVQIYRYMNSTQLGTANSGDNSIRFNAKRSGLLVCLVSLANHGESTADLNWTTFSVLIEIDNTATLCSQYPLSCFALVICPFSTIVFLFALFIHKIEKKNEALNNLVLEFYKDFRIRMVPTRWNHSMFIILYCFEL